MRSALLAGAWILVVLSGNVVQAAVSYLDNGTIKIGVNTSMGGSITYLAASSGTNTGVNLVNTADLGREIQQSYYSGPTPFSPPGVEKHPAWAGMPWNPIQAGDVYRNASPVLALSNNGTQIYVKTTPMQWALNNYPGDCTMENWISLQGNVASVHCRLTNARSDIRRYPAYTQELPAVYTNPVLDHLITYAGTQPFTGGTLSEMPPDVIWNPWRATEGWAAVVNNSNWGLGVIMPSSITWSGGYLSENCGYISPNKMEILDHNIVYDYSYKLLVGSLTDIRSYATANRSDLRPNYVFNGDRQHWYYKNASDTGWPTGDYLHVYWGPDSDPQMMGPAVAFQASDVPKLYIRAAYHGVSLGSDTAQLFWERNNGANLISDEQSYSFPIINDGQYHTYVLDLASNPNWSGQISWLRFDPASSGRRGSIDIQYISYIPEPSTVVLLVTGLLGLSAYAWRKQR